MQSLHRLLRRRLNSVLLVERVPEYGVWLYQHALDLEREGIVSKRLDSPYMTGVRSVDWIKIKRPGAVPAQRFEERAPKLYALSISQPFELSCCGTAA